MTLDPQIQSVLAGEAQGMVQYIIGDSAETLRGLPDGSVHFVCTSPPYWALRKYGGGDAQRGLEPDPASYIASMMEVFDELRRVLRNDGTLCVNLGDKYMAAVGKCKNPGGRTTTGESIEGRLRDAAVVPLVRPNITEARAMGIPDKSLCLIPERFALAMVERGWVLRNKVVWKKKSSMPSSARDRLKCSWEIVYVFAKGSRYYSDLEAARVPGHFDFSGVRGFREGHKANDYKPAVIRGKQVHSGANPGDAHEFDADDMPDWLTLGPQPSKIKHYAIYPVRVPLFFMRWLLPRAVCPACGAAWRRTVALVGGRTSGRTSERLAAAKKYGRPDGAAFASGLDSDDIAYHQTLSWQPGCSCGAEPIGATVLDPFGGPGTTAAAACWLFEHPEEGLDTVLADAHTEFRSGSGKAGHMPIGKHPDGLQGGGEILDVRRGPVRVGTPTSVFQPWIAGKAIMLDLDEACEKMYPARKADCFKSLSRNKAKPAPEPQPDGGLFPEAKP